MNDHPVKTHRIWIKITPEILKRSLVKDSKHCMVAEAIVEGMPFAKNVSIDTQTIRFTDRDRGMRYLYLTPIEVQEQITLFDLGDEIEPWEFRLPCRPTQVIKISSRAKLPLGEGPDKLAKEKPVIYGAVDNDSVNPPRFKHVRVPIVVGGEEPPPGALHHGEAKAPKTRTIRSHTRQWGGMMLSKKVARRLEALEEKAIERIGSGEK